MRRIKRDSVLRHGTVRPAGAAARNHHRRPVRVGGRTFLVFPVNGSCMPPSAWGRDGRRVLQRLPMKDGRETGESACPFKEPHRRHPAPILLRDPASTFHPPRPSSHRRSNRAFPAECSVSLNAFKRFSKRRWGALHRMRAVRKAMEFSPGFDALQSVHAGSTAYPVEWNPSNRCGREWGQSCGNLSCETGGDGGWGVCHRCGCSKRGADISILHRDPPLKRASERFRVVRLKGYVGADGISCLLLQD